VKNNKDKYHPLLGFVDLLLNLAVAFAFLFMLSQMLININKAKDSSAQREGKFIIEAVWTPGVDADIDLWAKAPNNERSGFFSRDVGTLSLLRDDLGNRNDYITDATGQQVLNPLNREEITVRTAIPGEYSVNLHYYRKPTEGNTEITVTVTFKTIKENTILASRTVILNKGGEEKTVFLIRLDNRGDLEKVESPEITTPWVVNNFVP
jgi:hypothetical protein